VAALTPTSFDFYLVCNTDGFPGQIHIAAVPTAVAAAVAWVTGTLFQKIDVTEEGGILQVVDDTFVVPTKYSKDGAAKKKSRYKYLLFEWVP